MTQTAFGLFLQSMREERGLSLRELAQLADIDHAYIYRLETGEKSSPSEEVLTKLIRALKAGKRDADILRYLAKHPETDNTLVRLTLEDNTISYGLFVSAAGAAFRGSGRPDYPKLIKKIRKILDEEMGHG